MSMFENIPHGKEDLPLLLPTSAAKFDINDVDGTEYMLDHKMEGCYGFFCTKQIQSIANATATMDGRKLEMFHCYCQLGPHEESVLGIKI